MVGRLPESWIPPEHLLELRARGPPAPHARRSAPRVAAAHPGRALPPRRPAAQLAARRRVARLAGQPRSCRRRRASRSRSRWRSSTGSTRSSRRSTASCAPTPSASRLPGADAPLRASGR
jgi:hypothetical protein